MRMGMSSRRFKKRYIIIAGMLLCAYVFLVRLQPTFQTLVHESANRVITTAIHEQVSKSFGKYDSDAFYTETENTWISNVSAINTLKSEIIDGLNQALSENGGKVVRIPLGSASGFYLLNGVGPGIPVRISPAESITADFESDFESAGINFVKHTLYLNVAVTVHYRGLALNEQEVIQTRIPVIENVTSGNVPEYYGSMGMVADGKTKTEP